MTINQQDVSAISEEAKAIMRTVINSKFPVRSNCDGSVSLGADALLAVAAGKGGRYDNLLCHVEGQVKILFVRDWFVFCFITLVSNNVRSLPRPLMLHLVLNKTMSLVAQRVTTNVHLWERQRPSARTRIMPLGLLLQSDATPTGIAASWLGNTPTLHLCRSLLIFCSYGESITNTTGCESSWRKLPVNGAKKSRHEWKTLPRPRPLLSVDMKDRDAGEDFPLSIQQL